MLMQTRSKNMSVSSPDRWRCSIAVGPIVLRARLVIALSVALCVAAGPAAAQDRYDDHELTDRFYITLGGYSQSDLRTTLRIDAKSPGRAIVAGAVIGLESLFDVDDKVTTGRLDGWYRFNKKHRIGWTYWRTSREGLSTYNGNESIEIGEIVIDPGDTISTDDRSQLVAVNWSYSLVDVRKYEFWLGAGLNFHKIDTTIDVNVGGGVNQLQESAKATIPCSRGFSGSRSASSPANWTTPVSSRNSISPRNSASAEASSGSISR